MSEADVDLRLSKLESMANQLSEHMLQAERDHLHLSARVLALNQTVVELGAQAGVADAEKLKATILARTKGFHQQLLANVEDSNPFQAAMLDDRDLPGETS